MNPTARISKCVERVCHNTLPWLIFFSLGASGFTLRLVEVLAAVPLDDTLGYLHVDLDVLDPSVGQANSLLVPGGLSVEQLIDAIGAIKARTQLGAAAITSYAPEYDSDKAVCRAAFGAIQAILGERA